MTRLSAKSTIRPTPPNPALFLLLLLNTPAHPSHAPTCTPCPPGEYTVRDCAPPLSTAAVCWPCEPGFACANGTDKRACRVGEEWSGVGMAECVPCSGACGAGRMLVRKCDDGVSDRVCAECPDGFGCGYGGLIRLCGPGTFSHDGVCVACARNYTTREAGARSEAECVCLTQTDDEGRCGGGCKEDEGEIAVNGECRACPPGFGCDRETGRLSRCAADTYSSAAGVCVACGANSHSAAGAGSEDECACDRGYVRNEDRRCVPCEPGTVFSDHDEDGGDAPTTASCAPCPAGEYCLGRLHHEPCPEDMFSHEGSVVCSACRMNSGCVRHRGSATRCIDQANCTCDDGFVDHGGECRRCPASTMKPLLRRRDELAVVEEGCIPCPRGMECMGGPDVRSCELATFSTGNQSRCSQCTGCREITVARCNATHDSVCEATPYALAVMTLTQYYKTLVDGETFAMFAMVLASSLPKAQLMKVCGGGEPRCVHCFQGQCPVARLKRVIVPPPPGAAYEIVIEIRSNAARLSTNVESLTQSAFLPEQAKTTMSKLTDLPFALRSRVDHAVICPDAAEWNGGECVPPITDNAARTWLGLGVSAVLLVLIGAYRGRRRSEMMDQKATWARVEEVTGSE